MPPSGIWAVPGIVSALKWIAGIVFGTASVVGCYYGAQAGMNERVAVISADVKVEAVKSAACVEKVGNLSARQGELRVEIQKQLDDIKKEIARGQDAISDIQQNSVRMAAEQIAMRDTLMDLRLMLRDFMKQPSPHGFLMPKDGTATP